MTKKKLIEHIYPFLLNVSFLRPLKSWENHWFSDAFKWYGKGTLGKNGWRILSFISWYISFHFCHFNVDRSWLWLAHFVRYSHYFVSILRQNFCLYVSFKQINNNDNHNDHNNDLCFETVKETPSCLQTSAHIPHSNRLPSGTCLIQTGTCLNEADRPLFKTGGRLFQTEKSLF